MATSKISSTSPSFSTESSASPSSVPEMKSSSLRRRRRRSVLDRIFGSANYCRRRQTSFNRDVEAEEFQDAASTFCLSSYYSVFVVRLAIMVCQYIYLFLTYYNWLNISNTMKIQDS